MRFPAILISKLFHQAQQIPTDLIDQYKIEFKKRFSIDSDSAGTNNFWFTEMWISENSPQQYRKLTNWMHLYSFARNLSAAFFLVFVYTTFLLLRNQVELSQLCPKHDTDVLVLRSMPLASYFLSVIMLIRYYYLYSTYYSTYLFRAFIFSQLNTRRDT